MRPAKHIAVALLLIIISVAGERNDTPEDGSAGGNLQASDCTGIMGEHSRADPITKECRCVANHEVVEGRCMPTERFTKRKKLLAGKPYEKSALGPDGMPLCYGAAQCAGALLEHLRPDFDSLGVCLDQVRETKEELDVLAANITSKLDDLAADAMLFKEQSTGLKVQNSRLLLELGELSAMGSNSEKLQRSMRLKITDIESVKRRVADMEKKIVRRKEQIKALERKGIDEFNTCEENTALLEDTYADNGIKKPK